VLIRKYMVNKLYKAFQVSIDYSYTLIRSWIVENDSYNAITLVKSHNIIRS
jgi:hypothetical protein